MITHLGKLGYNSVHNKCVDCWKEIEEGRIPDHDVLLTNPAYSGDHIPRLLEVTKEPHLAAP